MASVDGSRSYLAGSDEIIQHSCGPCGDEGEIKEGKYFCEVCNTYICFDCRNDHKQFKATKNHSIVSAHTSQGAGFTGTRGGFAIMCGCDKKHAITVYCEKHDEVICDTCEAVKHRNCKTCPIKDKVTKTTKKQLTGLADKAESLKEDMETLKHDAGTNFQKLDASGEECVKDIAAFRREINKRLDEMEKETLAKSDKTRNLQAKSIEKHITGVTAALQALGADLDTINNATKTNVDEIMFAANVKLRKSILEYDELIKDLRNNIELPKLEFVKNKKLVDMLTIEVDLGRIEKSAVTKSRSLQHDDVTILDMKVKSRKEVDIKLSDDERTAGITGCAFFSNGSILLCDFNNNKMKWLDSDMSIKSSLKLSWKPWNVATLSEYEAIITFFSSHIKDLQYIQIHPDLKLSKKITLPDKCYGLQVVNDGIYTCCHKGSGHDEIWKLDRTGNIISKVVLTQARSGESWYLGLCLTGSNPRVYLTDWDNNRVTCFQLDGRMVNKYEGNELKGPSGIYVDSVGNMLVCGTGSHNVVVITADGKKHEELLTCTDINWPRCIDHRPQDDTLIVGSCDSNKF